MQAIYKPVYSQFDLSFNISQFEVPYFYDTWHFHPEIEIVQILEGTGTRMIGDSLKPFKPEDLIMIGSNLPHVWKSDDLYYEKDSKILSRSRAFHFSPNFLGEKFLTIHETKQINKLFQEAQKGLVINGRTKKIVFSLFDRLIEEKVSFKKLLLFLEILHTIQENQDYEQLCTGNFLTTYHKNNTDKINQVFDYTLSNFSTKITLDDVATEANMSVSNFCRYFKSRMQKTYIQFLTEIRIGQACKLLIETEETVQEIAWKCGFNNLSNFNRSFKMAKHMSPLDYRKKYLNNA